MKRMAAAAMASLLCWAAAKPAVATELGDPAPALQVAQWVKGAPVDLAACAQSNIVVIEFWATWCGPCRASIPHLTELQKKYAAQGVLFVGVSSEDAAKVEPFVKDMGEKMDYRVAVDKENGTTKAYLEAFGIPGIPHAFVVDKEGRIAWSGHPMQDLDKTLDEILAGRYDLALNKKRTSSQQKLQALQVLLTQGGDEAKIKELDQELAALDKEIGHVMPDGSPYDLAALRKTTRMTKFNQLMFQYPQALAADEAAGKLEKMVAEIKVCAPEDFKAEKLADMPFQVFATKYLQAVTETNDATQAAKWAEKLDGVKSGNAFLLNQLAWLLLTDEAIQNRDIGLALRLAQRAYEASAGKDASVCDTYARALSDNGRLADAIRVQEEAVGLAKDPATKEPLEQTLQAYRAKAGGTEAPKVTASPAATPGKAAADTAPAPLSAEDIANLLTICTNTATGKTYDFAAVVQPLNPFDPNLSDEEKNQYRVPGKVSFVLKTMFTEVTRTPSQLSWMRVMEGTIDCFITGPDGQVVQTASVPPQKTWGRGDLAGSSGGGYFGTVPAAGEYTFVIYSRQATGLYGVKQTVRLKAIK